MSILEELHTLLSALGFPVETGHFTDTAPERYFVTIPLSDRFTLHADNRPGANIEEARISLFSKGSYHDTEAKNDTVSGDGFPLLYPGENTVSFDGKITGVEIIPRWATV